MGDAIHVSGAHTAQIKLKILTEITTSKTLNKLLHLKFNNLFFKFIALQSSDL